MSLNGSATLLRPLGENLRQRILRIERAWETGVGIEVRKDLLDLHDGKTLVEGLVNSGAECLDVADRLVGGQTDKALLLRCHSECIMNL